MRPFPKAYQQHHPGSTPAVCSSSKPPGSVRWSPQPRVPAGVRASFDFWGAKNDVAGRMLTVTLNNDLDGTVYL